MSKQNYCHTWYCSGADCSYCARERQRLLDGGALDLILETDPVAPYARAVELGYTFVGVVVC